MTDLFTVFRIAMSIGNVTILLGTGFSLHKLYLRGFSVNSFSLPSVILTYIGLHSFLFSYALMDMWLNYIIGIPGIILYGSILGLKMCRKR